MGFITLWMIGLLSVVSSSVAKNCEAPWVRYEDNCYYFHNITDTLLGHTRHDASVICQNFGGNLTSINSKNESNFISSIFNEKWVKQSQHYWIGLSDIKKEGTFVWDDGSVFNKSIYNNWRISEKEPNNYNNEDCVEVSWDGQWNDNKCYLRLGFICKRKIDAVIPPKPTLPSVPLVTNAPRTCEAGWIPWGTSCYGLIMGIPKTWKDARADCLRRFGDLVVIERKEELDFLTLELGRYSSEYWIGLHDQNIEGQFRWVNGKSINDTITSWRKNEPSNDYGVENCVEMYGKWAPGEWNDNYCDAIHDYVCEKQSGVHNCPQGWITHGDYCYQINAHPNQKTSWASAHEKCRSFNEPWQKKIDVAEAELVSISSDAERKMIYHEFKKMGIPGPGTYFWIGLYRNLTKGGNKDWFWTDRSPFKYQHWQGPHGLRHYQCVKSSLIDENSGWFRASCNEKHNFVCKVRRGQDRCFDPMGMQNFEIPDSAITTNSQLSFGTPAHAARLYLKAGNGLDGAWCAKNETKRPYLQIDFGQTQKLTYMAIQGKSNSPAVVSAFYFKYSLDGVSYDTYGDYPPAQFYKFRSSVAHRSTYERVMNLPLPAHLVARYVRVYPIDWHISCCLRVEFYGCSHSDENQKCGLGWREDKDSGHCYKFNTQRTSLDAASGLCQAQGAELLSITSTGEKNFIDKELRSLSGRYSDYWIGLTDLDTEGIFQWIDKSPVTMTNWYRNNPRLNDASSNCVTIRAFDGFWMNVDCTSYRTFICKRKYKHTALKKKLSNNWRTDAVYYWPLEDVEAGKSIGTVEAKAYGDYKSNDFPVPFDAKTNRHFLYLDGKKNYLEIPGLGKTCASNPDSSDCPNGITVSFLFYYHDVPSAKAKYVLDALGQKGRNTVGYAVFIKFSRIYVVLRGHEMYYSAYATFKRKWSHFIFKWSTLDGLKLYINGILKFRRLFGSRNPTYIKREDVTSLFIGKTASAPLYTRIKLLSLAIFDRVLTPPEIISIYKAELGRCEWGQMAHGSFCYEFNVTALNYMQALSSCERRTGSLMSVHSAIEQSFLSLSVGKYGLGSESWIGLNSNRHVNIYNWTDDTAVTYTHWGLAEPNNYRGRGEYCVNTYGGGFWNDNLCFLRKSFVCKYQRALTVDGSEKEEKSYNITLYLYQTRTFGCSLSKKVRLENVIYGNVKEGCVLDRGKAKKIVHEKSCKGPRCSDVRANDNYFNGENPCKEKRLSTKRLFITYSCVDDTSRDDTKGCPKLYSVFNGNGVCYRLYQKEMNVDDASKICKGDGGELASIANYYEELFLTTLMAQLYKQSDVWIGLTYDKETQHFSWMNGKKVIYTNWQNQLPDPRNGQNVKVSILEGADRFLFWSTANKTEKLPFFCRVLKKNATERRPAPTPASSGDCPKGWQRFKDNCYFANNQSLTQVQASAQCSKLATGSNLTSIMSSEENAFIYKLLLRQKSRYFSVWIGLTNEAITRGYRWLDYKPLAYINWNSNTPYTGPRHMCVGMNSAGKWWDLPCHTRYPSICKVKPGIHAKTTTATAKVTEKPGTTSCEKGWVGFKNSCYYFSKDPLDFHFAKLKCNNMSSYLVSINSTEENKFLADKMIGASATYKDRLSHYIGLHDTSTEDGWEWTDGSLVQYVNWQKDQPDDWHGEEDCVRMRYGGKWDDISCSLKYHFICEKDNGTVVKKAKPKPAPDTGYCSKGWVLYGSKCYLFKYGLKDRRNQDDAKKYCRQFDAGDLVSIHNNYENSFLLSQLRDAAISVYIGFNDYKEEGAFTWSDQSTVSYTNWYIRQPSRYRNEDCVEMFPFYLYRGHWNDIHCGKELGFICQHPSNRGPNPDPPAETGVRCPHGFAKYGKDCYAVFDETLTWEEADKACKAKKADLVSFHDPFRQGFVFSRFVQQTNITWIGLHIRPDESELHWSDNTRLDYNHWKNGQILYPKKNSVMCIAQVFSRKLDGRWVSRNCTDKLPYTCKITREKPVLVSQEQLSCAEGWTRHGNMCYKYFKAPERASWPEAREKCKRFGGDLATITSKKIQDIIYYMVRSSFASVWIGLNDREQEHVWRWSSGQPFSINGFVNWGSVEPNDNSGSENCVELQTANGKWNDLPCTIQHPYVCEHSLECKKPLGMENGSIPDYAITASNFTEGYYPRFARLRSKHKGLHTSWCTGITDRQQNLTINLGDLMHITLIQTQGLFPYHVISYRLFYSDDGIDWKSYTEMKGPNPEPRILPGNEKGSDIDGVSVDLHAVFVRFMPVLFKLTHTKNLVCMRVELFGCKSVCHKSLGLSNFGIPDSSLEVSSTLNENVTVSNLRIASSEKKEWCTKVGDSNPWIKIDFQHGMKITRVMAYGKGAKTFTLQLSNDGRYFRDYQNSNKTKVFSMATKVHELESPAITRYLKVLPKGDNVCLKLEVYGCEFDCDIPVGMVSKRLPDALISASTSHGDHVGSKARLMSSSDNYWRANVDDKSQYLQIDFTQAARITGVATQGCEGDMFVKSYYLQWSDDGNFWHRSTELINGNIDNDVIKKVKLKQSILARYLRINPSSWNINICMRVEIYGCPIKRFTLPVKPRKSVVLGSLRLTDEKYNDQLAVPTSQEFKTLEKKIQDSVKDVYAKDENFKNGVVEVFVNEFKPGSVVADFTVIVTDTEAKLADPIEVLQKKIRAGKVGELKVDKESPIYGKEKLKPVTSPPQVVTTPDHKSHKSVFYGVLRLTEEKYNENLVEPTSQEFMDMELKVQTAVKEVYAKDDDFKDGFVEVIVNGFRPGSVVADFTVIITNSEKKTVDPSEVLNKHIKTGKVGQLKVDVESSYYKEAVQVVVSKRIQTAESGLSEGGKIGLLVFFFMLIAAVLITGAVFYLKRSKRGFKLQFAHKSFENPVHIDFSTDEHGDSVHMMDSQD